MAATSGCADTDGSSGLGGGVGADAADDIPADLGSLTSGSRPMRGSVTTVPRSRHHSSCRVCKPRNGEQLNSTATSRMAGNIGCLRERDRSQSPALCGGSIGSIEHERIQKWWQRKLVRRSRKHTRKLSCSVAVIAGASAAAAAVGLCAMVNISVLPSGEMRVLWHQLSVRIRRHQINTDISPVLTSAATLNFPRSGDSLPGQQPSPRSSNFGDDADSHGGQEYISTIALDAKGEDRQRSSDNGRVDLLADLSELDGDELAPSISKGAEVVHRDHPGGSKPLNRNRGVPVASGITSVDGQLPRKRRRSLKSSTSSKGSNTKSYVKQTNHYRYSKQSKGSSSRSRSRGNDTKGKSNQRKRIRSSEGSASESSRSSSSENHYLRTTLDKLRARADEKEKADALTEEEDFYQFFLMDDDSLSSMPTYSPSAEPTPTYSPTVEPTPTYEPTYEPTFTALPSVNTNAPTFSMQPTTSTPEPTVLSPTFEPTLEPTER